MRKTTLFTRLSLWLALLLVVAMAVAPVAFAQEGDHSETTTAETHSTTEDHSTEAAGSDPFTPLGINGGLLLVQLFNFLLIAFVLSAILWRPAVNFIDSRSEKIKRGLEDAAKAARDVQAAEQEKEKILAQARADAAKAVEEARGRGDSVAKSIEAQARADADKIRTDAQAEAVNARNAELAGMRDQVLNIAVALAQNIMKETVDAKKQEKLVSDFFSSLPSGAKGLAGSLEVVSAMPLNDAEKTRVKKELGNESVTFSVEPAILGGLIVRSSDRVIDGSLRSGLSDLASRLN